MLLLKDHNLICIFTFTLGLLALVVVPLLEASASLQETWMQLLIVRGLRLLRLARVLRTIKRFKVVWRLVSGLLSAWDTMISTTCLILLWLYIFGCIAAEAPRRPLMTSFIFYTYKGGLRYTPYTAAIAGLEPS